MTTGYFDAMRMHLVRGRVIDDRDTPQSTSVVVIDEETVRRRFPNEDPLGR